MKLAGSINLLLICCLVVGTAWLMVDDSLLSRVMGTNEVFDTGNSSSKANNSDVAPASPLRAAASAFQWANKPKDGLSLPKTLGNKLKEAESAFDKQSSAMLGVGKFEAEIPIPVVHLPEFTKPNSSRVEKASYSPGQDDETIEALVDVDRVRKKQSIWGIEPELDEVEGLLDDFPSEKIETKALPSIAFDEKDEPDDNQFAGVLKVPSELHKLGKYGRALMDPNSTSNPDWWVAHLQGPQLTGRNQVRTTLDEVIFVALQNAPQIQIINTQPRIQETVVGEADAAFDWSHFISSTWNDSNQPLGSSLTVNGGQVGQRFIQRDWTFESGVRKQLRNGASLNVGQQIGTFDNNSDFLVPPDQGNSRLILDYRQPLLQGRGKQVATSQIALASLDLDTVSNESITALQEYLLEVVQAYWEVYRQRAILVQNLRSMERAGELLRQLKKRDGIDVRNDQLLRAEAALASRKSQVIRSEFELVNSQDRLINLTFGPNSTHADSVELLPDSADFPIGFEFQHEQIIQAAIHNRPEVHRSIAQIKAGAIRYDLAKNQLLPRLDAIVSSQVAGLRGDKNISGAINDQFGVGAPSYSVGFEYELPFGNRVAKRRLERSQLEAEVFYRQFQKQVGDVVLDARIASRRIRMLNKENMNNWTALQKAQEELRLIQERQRLNLDDGKTGSLYIEDVLASQARLTAAEARLVNSQTEQAVALVDLKRATGELLRNYESSMLPVSYSPIFPDYSIDENTDMSGQYGNVQGGFDYPGSAQSIPTSQLDPQFGYPVGQTSLEQTQSNMLVSEQFNDVEPGQTSHVSPQQQMVGTEIQYNNVATDTNFDRQLFQGDVPLQPSPQMAAQRKMPQDSNDFESKRTQAFDFAEQTNNAWSDRQKPAVQSHSVLNKEEGAVRQASSGFGFPEDAPGLFQR